MRYILLSFFRALLIRRRYISSSWITWNLSSPRVYRSGSFIGISFVFITGRRTTRVQIPFHDDEEEEGKEKRERSTQRVKKGAHINNVPSVSAARTNKSSFVVFEGEKGVFMVRKWFKMRLSWTFVRFEKNVFFLKVKRILLYARTHNATLMSSFRVPHARAHLRRKVVYFRR